MRVQFPLRRRRRRLVFPTHGDLDKIPNREGRGFALYRAVRPTESNATPAGNRLVYRAAAISALAGTLFGYDIGVISGAILFIKTDFGLSPILEEVVVSSVLLGPFIGAAAGGVLADRLGRRRC